MIKRREPPTIETVSRETLTLTREEFDNQETLFNLYIDQLQWWNERTNLVSRDVSRETLKEHIVHSLLPSLLNLCEGEQWIDAGSGGGLPGIPLAIVHREKQWTLNDVVKKKCAAMRQIAYRLKLDNIAVEEGSVGEIGSGEGGSIISKHAFSVENLVQLVKEKKWEKLVMLKGADEAIQEASRLDGEYAATLYSFDFGPEEAFYEGKGILVLSRSI